MKRLLVVGLIILIFVGMLFWHFVGESPVTMKVSNQIISIGIEK